MLTVLEAIRLSTDYLDKKGIESPRTNAELLLASILNCDRLKLYMSFERPLSEIEKQSYRELIQRRGKFEPLQYITGKTDFYGAEFDISPDVLIPRPETEFIIEALVSRLDNGAPLRILDIGCGSGVIPVTLARFFKNAEIKSIDINPSALQCAKKNASKMNVEEMITFELLDILSPEAENSINGHDIIISNPPYVSQKEFSKLQEEIVKYEPRLAVTDEGDGLTFYRRISALASAKLNSGGMLVFEMGMGQSEEIKRMFEQHGFSNIEIIKDLQKIDRIILGRKL